MRVLAIGNSFPPHAFGGGYEAVWEGAVKHLTARGHDVRILTVTDLRGERSLPEVADTHRELPWYWRDHGFPPRPLRECLAIERRSLSIFERHVRQFEPDVVSWWSMGGMTLSLVEAARRRALPAVAFVHDDWLDYGRRTDGWHVRARRRRYPPAVMEGLLRVPGRIHFDRAAHYAFVSDCTRAHAITKGLNLPDTSVLHSGIGPWFRPTPERLWGGRLLYVGRLDPRKGVDTTVEALQHLSDATLTVIGDGRRDYVAELRQLTKSRGVEDRVHFAGHVAADELANAYAASDAVVFPVVWKEPWGLVPLEAMASGRPVLATGRGGSAEYLSDGENALLFEAGSAQQLAAAVERLGGDPGLRASLRKGGLTAAGKHTATAFNEGVERTLEAALATSIPRRSRRVPH